MPCRSSLSFQSGWSSANRPYTAHLRADPESEPVFYGPFPRARARLDLRLCSLCTANSRDAE
eukprot:1743639-Pleurochrysis_carterae.AAC.2